MHELVIDDKAPITISDDEYLDIKYLTIPRDKFARLIGFLREKCGFSAKHANSIAKILAKSRQFTSIYRYLLNKDTHGITLQQLLKGGNIYSVFNDIAEPAIVSEVYNLVYREIPPMGKGELLLPLFIRGCKRSLLPNADIEIDNKVYELKATNGRLVNQTFFGQSHSTYVYWAKYLKDHFEYQLSSDAICNFKKKRNDFVDICNDLPFESKLEYIQMLKTGLERTYLHTVPEELAFIDEYVKGKREYHQLLSGLIKMNIRYFLRLTGLDRTGIVVFNSEGNVVLLNSHRVDRYDKYVKVTSLPSFSLASGAHASAIGIAAL